MIPAKWWPWLVLASPILAPYLLLENVRFQRNRNRAVELNQKRIETAEAIALPELDHLKITVLVEWMHEAGFLGAPGVSYLFRTEQGSLLFDIGFGVASPTLTHNVTQVGLDLGQVNALAISHLHGDHMGGFRSQRTRRLPSPVALNIPTDLPCYLPTPAEAEGWRSQVVAQPGLLTAGLGSTGPLVRNLFFFGLTEEQAILAKLKDRGLAIFTGCGHPTVKTAFEMAHRLCPEPIYAFGGGLHFPITSGRGLGGSNLQMMVGTGKPPWQRITDADLTETVQVLNDSGVQKVFLSAHDTCDYALERLSHELNAEVSILKAGATYEV
ncbi:MAG: MBL fold metallo-hydrolase [Leptolyngbyaceae cyanobacterium MO_188.B28]|nr:MBL fold metallo-hydrolase [Leptolyngbyaceae cyanobacterium MO_188.B28]